VYNIKVKGEAKMLTNNKDSQKLTLKLIQKTNNELVKKEFGAITLISEDKTLYLYMACENCTVDCPCKCMRKLKGILSRFIATNKYNINIDIPSFMEHYQPKHMKAFRVIVETILFSTHKMVSRKEKQSTDDVIYNLVYSAVPEFDEIFTESEIKMEFVNFARDLQDLPPNEGISTKIAELIEAKAKTIEGVKIKIYNKAEIEKMGMGLLLAVNAGSEVEPRVVVLEYNGDTSKPKTALVGKGITFDSGGYNLKPGNFMKGMKFDMSGAAIMSSTVMALAKAKAKANVMSVAMLTDNRIGGHATLTESVIKSYNGKTVQIDNTDAEGRLVLADGITYALRDGKADRVIESSTLTGAIVVALGKWHTGVFTKSEELWTELEAAAGTQPELVWRMPMIWEHLDRMKNTPIADLTNAEPMREAGSATAAAFLNVFAEGKPYMHLDIAGTADNGARGKAVMLRSLFEMLK
jgi:leucyl aminopeptidase